MASVRYSVALHGSPQYPRTLSGSVGEPRCGELGRLGNPRLPTQQSLEEHCDASYRRCHHRHHHHYHHFPHHHHRHDGHRYHVITTTIAQAAQEPEEEEEEKEKVL